jgi:hypothetical protein
MEWISRDSAQFLDWIAYAALVGLLADFTLVFSIAYKTKDKVICLGFNESGEAFFELCLLSLVWLLVIMVLAMKSKKIGGGNDDFENGT